MGKRRAAAVTCQAAMMALSIALNLPPILLTTLSHDLGGLTNEQLGRIGATLFAGLVAGILTTGPLADRFGARPFALAGALLTAAGLIILSRASSFSAVLTACAVMGAGAGILDMVLSPIAAALSPENRTGAMNLLHSFYCIGAVATVVAGAIALGQGVDWRTLSFGLASLPAAVAIAFAVVLVPPLAHDGATRTPIRLLTRQTFFAAACAAIFLGGATEAGMAQWLPAYTEIELGYSKATGSIALSAFSLAMALGRLATGAFAGRFDTLSLLAASSAATILFFFGGSFLPSSGLALASCVLAGLAGSALWPSVLAVTADQYPNGGASMFGLLAAAGNAGGIAMPWLVGAVADRSSLAIGLAVCSLCPAAMIVALGWMRRHRHG